MAKEKQRSERDIALSCVGKAVRALEEYQKVRDGEAYVMLGEWREAIGDVLAKMRGFDVL